MMKTQKKLNLTMLCDFYELTMGNGYFQNGYKDRITYFDVFFGVIFHNFLVFDYDANLQRFF